MVSGMDATLSCIFNLCDVRMRITCIKSVWCPGATSGVLFKKKSVYGGSFTMGEVGKGKVKRKIRTTLNFEHTCLK